MTTEQTPTPPSTMPDQLNDLRRRVLAGEKISPEEYAQVIESLRKKRLSDATASAEVKAEKKAKAAAKPKAAPVDLDVLFKNIGL